MKEGLMEQLLLVASNLSFVLGGYFLYLGEMIIVFGFIALGGFLQYQIFKEDEEK